MPRRKRTRRPRGLTLLGMARLLFLLVLLTAFTPGGTVFAYNYYQDQNTNLQRIANGSMSQATSIYDRNGVLLYRAYDPNDGSGKRVPVRFNDIPKVLQDALISTEDPTFWDNDGFDPQALLRVVGTLGASGGSTLTQQLVKQLTGNDARSGLQGVKRKGDEIMLASALTQGYSKAKILEMYFNISPFSISDLGVEAATQKFFPLSPICDSMTASPETYRCQPAVSRLNQNSQGQDDPILGLARASLLAAMPQNPAHLDPTLPGVDPGDPLGRTYLQQALDRQLYVLNQMLKHHVIIDKLGPLTSEMVNQASVLTGNMQFKAPPNNKLAPHFVDWVIGEISDQIGIETFLTGGFQIRTSLDINMQEYTEQTIKYYLTQKTCLTATGCGPLNVTNNVNNGAALVMNSHTGEILAMAGSADYYSTDPKVAGSYNSATMGIGRQPGSTFKPIVYATTFEMGWYPAMRLGDRLTAFPNGAPAGTDANPEHAYIPPDNSTFTNTNMTVRQAIAESRNIPAVAALQYAGVENVLNMARRLGITSLDRWVDYQNQKNNTSLPPDRLLRTLSSMPLGSVETPLFQMVGAYQTFANAGLRVAPQGILDIWDNYGRKLYHYDPNNPPTIRALSPQVAYLITSILMDEPSRRGEFGDIHTLSFSDIEPMCKTQRACPLQVAAKTGTTDHLKDNLAIGYTPSVVVGVWVGNANGEPMKDVIGITGAGPIWHSIIERAAGFCPQASAGLPCGNFDLSLKEPLTFPQPDGLICAPTSASNGLAGKDSSCDWMLTGEEPQQP